MAATQSNKRINFVCNDCDRGFTNEKAWRYHGENTGHNINGDLPGKQQREVGELRAELDKLQTAYGLVNQERARQSIALSIIRNALLQLGGGGR